jgi:hypothetical protein
MLTLYTTPVIYLFFVRPAGAALLAATRDQPETGPAPAGRRR